MFGRTVLKHSGHKASHPACPGTSGAPETAGCAARGRAERRAHAAERAGGLRQGAIAAVDALVTLARQRQFDASVRTQAAAIRAYLWLMQGNLVAAAHWADTSGLSPNNPACFSLERENFVLARVLIARESVAAPPFLDRMLRDAEAHGRWGSAIEILALRALARQALGDKVRALQDLECALAFGEPEGHARVFVDEGAPMATLLRRARSRGIAPEYTTRLLTVLGDGTDVIPSGAIPRSLQFTTPDRLGAPGRLPEALSARERDILELIVMGASNREIAKRLFLTIGTVKKHVH